MKRPSRKVKGGGSQGFLFDGPPNGFLKGAVDGDVSFQPKVRKTSSRILDMILRQGHQEEPVAQTLRLLFR